MRGRSCPIRGLSIDRRATPSTSTELLGDGGDRESASCAARSAGALGGRGDRQVARRGAALLVRARPAACTSTARSNVRVDRARRTHAKLDMARRSRSSPASARWTAARESAQWPTVPRRAVTLSGGTRASRAARTPRIARYAVSAHDVGVEDTRRANRVLASADHRGREPPRCRAACLRAHLAVDLARAAQAIAVQRCSSRFVAISPARCAPRSRRLAHGFGITIRGKPRCNSQPRITYAVADDHPTPRSPTSTRSCASRSAASSTASSRRTRSSGRTSNGSLTRSSRSSPRRACSD